MTEPNLKKLGSPDFNAEKYVKELTQKCVGGQELQRVRNKIQALTSEASGALKKNVYQNYVQFIDTAKEISHMESEMYQLSHMLTEQRSLLAELASTSILENDNIKENVKESNEEKTDDKEKESVTQEQEEEKRRRTLTTILEKVEGCMSLLEPSSRSLTHEGDLLELDPVENTALQRCHAYLFNDCFMLTTWIPNRRGPMRYKFEKMYELGSLAVVNVRDLGSVKFAFKLLAFPDTKVFQCSSNSSKKEWLDKFDQVKKARRTQEQIKREGTTGTERSPSRTASIDSPIGNPFLNEPDFEGIEIPEWVLEVAEELDVLLAQRHHEEALELLERAQEFITNLKTPDHSLDNKILDIKQKMDVRRRSLVDVLMKELEVSPGKSLQGGLRATRRPVRLLKMLGKSSQACDLFLQLCSSILKIHTKHVKREGSTTVYVKHLAAVVFSNMAEMTEEFLRAFPNSPPCASAFIVWVSTEVGIFTSHIIKQLFHSQQTISVLAECILTTRTEAEQLWDYGIDIVYQITGAIRAPLSRSLSDCRDKLVDAARLRAAEDLWRPTNLGTNTALTKTLNQYSDLGLDLSGYTAGECWIELTNNTLYFVKMYLTLLEDCLKLSSPELQYNLDETLFDVFQAQLKHVEISIRNENKPEAKKFMIKNGLFLLNDLLPLVEKKYLTSCNFNCEMLGRLRDEFCNIKKITTPITKYSSNEYL
ncbi:exocyst complex component 8 [Chrysoperla carnea]|uniref:exocyst complex component 8 n=1 Tax=Chrysoperla carnea TaxID=189513 RepID=UPI001D06F684|nr:exocyst complex component 8 [Chrysoperla carnea]